jgi:hypothetical protein
MDPDMMAQALMGMLFSYAIRLGLETDSLTDSVSVEAVVTQFVDILMRGIVNSGTPEK